MLWNNLVFKGLTYFNTFVLSDKDNDKDKLNTDPFSYLKENAITDNPELKSTAVSFYKLMMVVSVVGLLATFSVAGYKLAMARTSSDVNEAKKEIMAKMFIGIIIFGLVGILGIFFEIARGLV